MDEYGQFRKGFEEAQRVYRVYSVRYTHCPANVVRDKTLAHKPPDDASQYWLGYSSGTEYEFEKQRKSRAPQKGAPAPFALRARYQQPAEIKMSFIRHLESQENPMYKAGAEGAAIVWEQNKKCITDVESLAKVYGELRAKGPSPQFGRPFVVGYMSTLEDLAKQCAGELGEVYGIDYNLGCDTTSVDYIMGQKTLAAAWDIYVTEDDETNIARMTAKRDYLLRHIPDSLMSECARQGYLIELRVRVLALDIVLPPPVTVLALQACNPSSAGWPTKTPVVRPSLPPTTPTCPCE